LESIQKKKAAVDSISSDLAVNSEVKDIVKGYLPEDKAEEKIINGVNYLAGDANISLVSISLTSPKRVSASDIDANALVSNIVIDPLTGQEVLVNPNPIKQTSAKIALMGDYEKIRIFLDNLQRMPIFNTIKSISISKQKTTTQDVAVADSSLTVDLVVDFGYLNIGKVTGAQAETFVSDIDKKTVDVLREYVSQKSQLNESEIGSKGKTNPFLSN
jgi:hypothetical protein